MGTFEISVVGLQHADRYISVVNTDAAQWSRPDLLCLVAGLGVVAIEERALVGSCDRRTAVGRRDYAVIITLLWLGRRAARPRATTGANVHTVGKGTKQRSLRLEAGDDAAVGEPRSPEVGRDPHSTKFTEQHQLPRSDQRGDPQALAASTIGQLRPSELERLPGLLTVLARSDITGLKRIITLSAGATQLRGVR